LLKASIFLYVRVVIIVTILQKNLKQILSIQTLQFMAILYTFNV